MFNNHNGWGNFLHQPQSQNQELLLSDLEDHGIQKKIQIFPSIRMTDNPFILTCKKVT